MGYITLETGHWQDVLVVSQVEIDHVLLVQIVGIPLPFLVFALRLVMHRIMLRGREMDGRGWRGAVDMVQL